MPTCLTHTVRVCTKNSIQVAHPGLLAPKSGSPDQSQVAQTPHLLEKVKHVNTSGSFPRSESNSEGDITKKMGSEPILVMLLSLYIAFALWKQSIMHSSFQNFNLWGSLKQHDKS